MFNDGVLVPNTELGHMEIRGRDAERRSAAVARTRRGLSWKAWATDLDEHLHAIDRLFWPNLIILGGGVSKNADKFIPRLTVRPRVVPATLRNDAGIVGAAMAAAERFVEGAGGSAGLSRPVAAYHLRLTNRGRPPPACPHEDPPTDDDRAARAGAAPPPRPRRPPGWSSAASPSTPPTARRSRSSTPPTARSIATAPLGGREDVDRAVAAAQTAFEDRKGWANWAAGKRGRTLAKLADLIKKHSEELA